MTLRAGSADASKPDYRGLIRHDSSPWYICYHNTHGETAEARQCARKAIAWMKTHEGLPEGWITYKSFRESFREFR
jgi:hypothetical protein